MSDGYEQALRHLNLAYAAMGAVGDTLALATIAQALSIVEAACGRAPGPEPAIGHPANRLPC